MRRAQQKSYCKSGVNWHGGPKESQALAGTMVIYTLPDEMIPDNLALGSLAQERYFEARVRDESIRYQKEVLEPDPRYQKPSALAAVETKPFDGSQKFGEWLAQRREASIEEVLAYEEPRIQDEVEAA